MIQGMYTELRDAYAQAGKLFEVHLDVLYQCDLDCEHCYLDEKNVQLQPTAFWREVIDQCADLEVVSLQLSGGELFLRPDALDLIAHARSRGLFVHVKTHGGTVDAETAGAMADLGVSTVFVSYYAADPCIHDAITRRAGSHAKTRQALELLVRRRVHTVAVMPVMARNADQVAAVARECRQLGLSLRVDGEIRVANSGEAGPRAVAMDPQARLDFEAARAAEGEGGHCEVATEGGSATRWGDEANCAAGVVALYVGPTGEVTPCVTWPEPLGRLDAGDTLRDLWEQHPRLASIRALRRRDRGVCAGCELKGDCGYCLGQGYLEHGEALRPPTVVCETTWSKAKARAALAGEPTPAMPPGLAGGPRPRFRVLRQAEVAALEPQRRSGGA